MLFKMYIEPNLVPRAFPHVVPSPPTTKKKAQRTKSDWDQPRSQGFPYVVPEFILKKEKKLEESKARRIRKSRTMKWQVIWICWMTWFKLQTRYPTGQLSHCLSYSSKNEMLAHSLMQKSSRFYLKKITLCITGIGGCIRQRFFQLFNVQLFMTSVQYF